VPPPGAASHPPPADPYDSPDRYNKSPPGEGPTEDPFHLREEARIAREKPIQEAKAFDEVIQKHASANVAARVAAGLVNR
jgi:hypothetical protein